MSVSVVLSDELAEAARRAVSPDSELADHERVGRGVEIAIRRMAADFDAATGAPSGDFDRSTAAVEDMLLASMDKGPGVVGDDAYWADLRRRVKTELVPEPVA